jgi:iron complex outermembrane receptor protein
MIKRTSFGLRSVLSLSASLSVLGLATVPAHAQSAAPDENQQAERSTGSVMDEILVSAQRRSENLQDVPIAITAFSGEQLDRLGIDESTDIAQFVPGVTLTGSSGGQFVSFSIRGVSQNEFSDFAEAPNAVYIDDAYIAMMNSQRFATFDIDRVEVLKGPQGTLFGRNATGGLVHYLSRRPTASVEGYVDLTYGSYNQVRVETALGGPLSEKVRARAAVFYNRHDEILENVFPGGDDEWNDNTLAGRLHLEFLPTENLTVLLTAYGGRSRISSAPYQSFPTIPVYDANGNVISSKPVATGETRAGIGPGGVNTCPGCFFGPVRPVPGGDGLGFVDPDGEGFKVSKDAADSRGSLYWMAGGTGHVEWDLGGVQLVSVTDYKRTSKDTIFEVDNSPLNQLLFPAIAEGEQFSQEIRLSGSDGPFNWLTGAYFLDFTLDPVQSGFIFPALTPGGPNVLGPAFAGTWFQNSGIQHTQSYSGFAEATFEASPEMELVLGGRVTLEKKRFTQRADIVSEDGAAVLVANFNPAALQNLRSSDTLFSGRAQLNYRPSDGLLFYAGVNRGVKAGGFNQNLAGLPPVPPSFRYDPEVLTAYEAGFKTTIFDGTTRFNGNLYYYDYTDYQAFQFVGLSNFVVNVDAVYKGGELELASSPFDGLDLLLNASYIDAVVKDVPFSSGPGGTGTVLLDREPAYTPKFQAAGLVRYGWDTLGGRLSVQADASYSDGFFYFLSNYPSTRLDARFIANSRISWANSAENLIVDLFVENVFDERYKQIGFDLSTTCGCSVASYGMPRWFGVSLRRKIM